MKRKELMLRHGGLMRCCTASFVEWAHEKPDAEAEPGEEISCRYEHKVTMVVNDRATYVEWIHSPYRNA